MRQGEAEGLADESGADSQQGSDDFLADSRPAQRSGAGPALVEQPASPAPHNEARDDQLLAEWLGMTRRVGNELSPGHPWKIGARGIALQLSETLDRRDSPPLRITPQPSRRDDR